MTIKEEPQVTDKKGKIIDFKTADKDEIYWRTKKGLLSSDKIQIFKPVTIIEIWAFTVIIFIVAISGLFLLRDWLFLNFGIYGDSYTEAIIKNTHSSTAIEGNRLSLSQVSDLADGREVMASR